MNVGDCGNRHRQAKKRKIAVDVIKGWALSTAATDRWMQDTENFATGYVWGMKMPSKETTNSVETKGADKMPGVDSTQKSNTYEKGAESKKIGQFQRRIDKSKIPTCKILGVDIAAIDMNWLLKYTSKNLDKLRGDYMCVVNVYSDVTAYNDPEFCKILNSSALCMPDGGPLSTVGRWRGYKKMQRTTGPSYMGEIFKMSQDRPLKHFFYGSTDSTLSKLREKLLDEYPGLNIVGMYSPPFRPTTDEEDQLIVERINELQPDFVWVGLSCPKQERWMYEHLGRVNGLMVGVGAGFDYYAGNISRAPEWMQKHNLEWVYRLIQEPKRLFSKYWHTNFKFIWLAMVRGK